MNGTSEPKPATNASVILLVVLTLALNGTIGMSALGYCLIFKVEPNTTILTAFVGLVNYVLGAVSGMLVKTSPTETQKQVMPAPIPTEEHPLPTQIMNEPKDPVPITEEKKGK